MQSLERAATLKILYIISFALQAQVLNNARQQFHVLWIVYIFKYFRTTACFTKIVYKLSVS